VIVALVIYAYGFQVTKVNLEETRSPRRQEQLIRILRALARPDLITYDRDEFLVRTPILVPCGEQALPQVEVHDELPYMLVTPDCAPPRGQVEVEGYNFEPNTTGPISFIPPSEVRLQLGNVQIDSHGHFATTVTLPNRPEDEIQYLEVLTRRNVGAPHWTKTAHDTWDKIIETVFLALLATTLGTAIAVPLSFIAARNLMRGIKSPMSSIALSVIALPIGAYLGSQAADLVSRLISAIPAASGYTLLSLIGGGLISSTLTRWALPQTELRAPGLALRSARLVGLALAGVLAIALLFLLARFGRTVGLQMSLALGSASFLGKFVADLGDILGMLVHLITALAGIGIVVNLAARIGVLTATRLAPLPSRVIDLVLAAAAGAIVLMLIGAVFDWFYRFEDPMITMVWPGAIGALAAVGLSWRYGRQETLPIGLVVYYVSRTIFNALRSIEPLIMVIVFAVWVGIGPFAGVLALSLHTIAALAKLYSEQVESILPGPLEAITATGATRMQTIIYAVVPQIVPPYISFTMYRWDINVRMSTIIGFAGGGGIGFLLQQNINLLNYRAASAQMLAIALVVASMDYISSRLREKAV
jgi:phosphonate ABC transporter permease subunit PhnE